MEPCIQHKLPLDMDFRDSPTVLKPDMNFSTLFIAPNRQIKLNMPGN